MNIYVGNLSYDAVDADIREAFAAFGEVTDVRIIMDRQTNRSKGFGFVDMANDEEGKKAIEEMNGKDIKGREIKVNEARPKSDAPRRDSY